MNDITNRSTLAQMSKSDFARSLLASVSLRLISSRGSPRERALLAFLRFPVRRRRRGACGQTFAINSRLLCPLARPICAPDRLSTAWTPPLRPAVRAAMQMKQHQNSFEAIGGDISAECTRVGMRRRRPRVLSFASPLRRVALTSRQRGCYEMHTRNPRSIVRVRRPCECVRRAVPSRMQAERA